MKVLTLVAWMGLIQPSDSLLTLEQAIATALEQNFEILLVQQDLRFARQNNTIGNAGFLPTVDLTGSASESIQDTEQTLEFGDGPVIQTLDGAASTRYNAGVNLNWTLFDGLRMFASKQRLEALEIDGAYALQAQIQLTVANVITAYYQAALEQDRLSLLRSSLQLSDERVRISKDKYEVGKASKLEYLQAQVDYNTDKSALVRQEEVLANRKLDLNLVVGDGKNETDYVLINDYGELPIYDLEAIEAQALTDNPELQQLINQKTIADFSIKEEERDLLPSVDFDLGYNFSEQTNEVGVLRVNQATGVNYGLTARMTLFDGFNQRREIQNARIVATSATINYDQAKIQLKTNLRAAYLTYTNSITLAGLEKENLAVAKENEAIALERFRIGKSNALEIREAQNNALNAEIRYLEALNTAKIAETELLRLAGQLVKQ